MSTPAFLSELMGIAFYLHVDRLLDEIFAEEPEARDRIRALLQEIMVDELAHIGQRRNYIGLVVAIGDDVVMTVLYKRQFLCNVQYTKADGDALKIFNYVVDEHAAKLEMV